MRKYMKAKRGSGLHKTTDCDRDGGNRDTNEEVGGRRREFKSEGSLWGGAHGGWDERERPGRVRTRKQSKISNWNQVS